MGRLTVEGLRTQESDKFNRFFSEVVQRAAAEKDCVFFCDCGEGRDFENDVMEGEDLSGWLIPSSMVKKFKKDFTKRKVPDKWNEFISFCIWEGGRDNISVRFEAY